MLNCLVIVEHYLNRVDPGNHLSPMALLQIITKYKRAQKLCTFHKGGVSMLALYSRSDHYALVNDASAEHRSLPSKRPAEWQRDTNIGEQNAACSTEIKRPVRNRNRTSHETKYSVEEKKTHKTPHVFVAMTACVYY
jgi:hypothetical protein